ncbi:hypothetical protein BKA62DRAFT_795448 [Auriculariales sp. MPI-PUGE-AT-0066]|nr:hypothetical protein BKA62DRAFT_795448 [Auriculariales sp. MPI-PUGE-AT-0066]
MRLSIVFGGVALYVSAARAHVAAFAPGMYCKNGWSDVDQPETLEIVEPLYHLPYELWWMHGRCRFHPPPEGEFLELPAGGAAVVELANNKGFTTLGYHGRYVSDWTDGLEHPEFEDGTWPKDTCIGDPNLHNFSMAQGTAFAISYTSNINEVNLDNLVVFSVAPRTPWKRLTAYEVPADMPACPEGGCICAWGWVPDGCGQPNMYMTPFRCKVTGARPDAPKLAKPQVPVWCQDEPEKCVTGAKQFLAWHQKEGNNIVFPEFAEEKGAIWRSPAYNMKMGFQPGAQTDIFERVATTAVPVPPQTPVPTSIPTSSPVPTPSPVPAPTVTPSPLPEPSQSAPVPSAPTPTPVPVPVPTTTPIPVPTPSTTTVELPKTGIQPPIESIPSDRLPVNGQRYRHPGHGWEGHVRARGYRGRARRSSGFGHSSP